MPLDRERCHGPAGCGICTEPHWLLQRCTTCTTTVNHWAVILQRAQNAAARLVFGLRSHDHITPAVAQLHWLPVQFCIKFKLCLLMHQIHVERRQAYLAELVSSSAENCRRPGLRSTSNSVYLKSRLRKKFAERAFSYSGPAEWHCLPSDLRMITDTTI